MCKAAFMAPLCSATVGHGTGEERRGELEEKFGSAEPCTDVFCYLLIKTPSQGCAERSASTLYAPSCLRIL